VQSPAAEPAGIDGEHMPPRYEVMFVLDAEPAAVPSLREQLAVLGDSVVVAAVDGGWSCHVHTDRIGPVIEAAIAVGHPRGIEVTDLGRDVDHGPEDRSPVFEAHIEAAVAPVGVVAVVAGGGLVDLFRGLLVQGVVPGGHHSSPSAEALLAAVESIPANKVVVLPNSRSIVPVAEQLDALTTKDVIVVPTRSIPQGVAAMLGYSTGEESLEDAAQTMSAAASSIIAAEISTAARNAKVEGLGQISQGDWIGIIDGTPIVSHPDPWTAVSMLIRRIMTAPIELVTVYVGADADPDVTDALSALVETEYPGTTAVVVDGGQPHHPYLLSFE
jgi:hypothetical protein